MRLTQQPFTLVACLATLVLGGCQVDRTQEAEAPDVDVDVDPGRWPQYDVNWADVDVGTTERTITVPVVRVEQETRTVTVPYIDINAPDASEREERTISMNVYVPSSGYNLRITEVRAAGDDLWVIGELTAPASGTAAAQAVTEVSDQVVVNAPPDLDVRTVVVGQRPDGIHNDHRFVPSAAALESQMPGNTRVIYKRGTPG